MASTIDYASALNFVHDNTAYVTFDTTDGYVGIGTTAPRQLLDVSGGNAIFSSSVGVGTTLPIVALDVRGDTNITGDTNISGDVTFNKRVLENQGNLGLFGNVLTLTDGNVAQYQGFGTIDGIDVVGWQNGSIVTLHLLASGGSIILRNNIVATSMPFFLLHSAPWTITSGQEWLLSLILLSYGANRYWYEVSRTSIVP
jgi:hypothetical protein